MVLQINLCRTKRYKYYAVTATTFATGTQNIRRNDFSNSVYFGLPGK